ncbi:MAG: tRNA epoxyqueuosine(34) reductase QueG [Bacteroides sp.]
MNLKSSPKEFPATPDLSLAIKAEALRLGFDACGIAPADAVDQSTAAALHRWLACHHQADMHYMNNYTDKRLDPRLLMEGTRSIVCVALNYYPPQFLPADACQLAWYAYGKDYHDLMKAKLATLQEFIVRHSPTPVQQSRTFCDTAPVLERYWAWRAGLGWIGKNTQLILPHSGSCFFLGEVFIDTEVNAYDMPQANRCGNCTRCLQACPTQALQAPYTLCAERCLSYLTIEHHGDIPPAQVQQMNNQIYGCNDCLKACPWNRFATPTLISEFHPSPALLTMRRTDWLTLSEEQYKILFKGSAVKRAKYKGLVRNIHAAATNPLPRDEQSFTNS